MRHSRRPLFTLLRIASAILCVTFTWTSAAPAWALRAEGVANPGTKVGLEEALGRQSMADVPHPLLAPGVPRFWEIGVDHHDHGDCGIWCHVGPSRVEGGLDPKEVVPLGARDLEHRGYQSSGFVSLAPGEEAKGAKALGGSESLKNSMGEGWSHDPSTVQLVHLRWPTTSPATIQNAHPIEVKGQPGVIEPLFVAFNGDVKNFDVLDAFLKSKYEEFKVRRIDDPNLLRPEGVGTDAWTIGALVYYYYRYETNHERPEDLIEAVRQAMRQMTGYYAVTITSVDFPNLAVGFVQSDMPLYIGLGEDRPGRRLGNFLSSEPGAFVNWARYSQKLSSGDIALVSPDRVEIFAEEDHELRSVSTVTSDDTNEMVARGEIPPRARRITELDPSEYFYELDPAYHHYTEQEIMFQPAAVVQTIFGYQPPSLYPDQLPYELTDDERWVDRAFRSQVQNWMIDHQQIPAQEDLGTLLATVRDGARRHGVNIGAPQITPSKINEGRVETLRRAIADPGKAGTRGRQLAGVNWSRGQIRGFRKILAGASGTSGYAFKAWLANLENYTGLPADVWDGSKYLDKVEDAVRFAVDGLEVHGWRLPDIVSTKVAERYRKHQLEPEDLIEIINGLKAQVLSDPQGGKIPEVGRFRAMVDEAKVTATIIISQSGGTKDTLNIINVARALGMTFLSIINRPGVTDLGDKTRDDGGLFRTYAGTEKGVASTKAHTSQETALEVVGLYLGLVRGTVSPQVAGVRLHELLAMPDRIRTFLNNVGVQAQIRRLADELRRQSAAYYFGRGGGARLEAVAEEGALKIKELTYILAEGANLGEMKHGPIAYFPGTQDPRLTRYAVIVMTDRAAQDRAFLNTREIVGREGRVVLVAYEGDERFAEFLRKAAGDVEVELRSLQEHLHRMHHDEVTLDAYLTKIREGVYRDEVSNEQLGEIERLAGELREEGIGLDVHLGRLERTQRRLARQLDRILYVPAVPDHLAPMIAVVPLQLLALETTLATDRLATQVAEDAEDLFWAIERLERAGPDTGAILERRFNATFRTMFERFTTWREDGDLDFIEDAKLMQLERLFRNVESAPALGERLARARELMRAMAGRRASRLYFFRTLVDELMPEAQPGTAEYFQLLSIQSELEQAQARASQIQGASQSARRMDGSYYLNVTNADLQMMETAYRRLEPFISLLAQREQAGRTLSGGGGANRLVQRYNSWQDEIGLAEYLARNPDQPRGIAKIVTVEDRIERDVLQRLREVAPTAGVSVLWTALEQGRMQLTASPVEPVTGEMSEVAGVIPLVASVEGMSPADVRRHALYHEKAHYLLNLAPPTARSALLDAFRAAIDRKDTEDFVAQERLAQPYRPFRQQFEARFGPFDTDEAFLVEVIVKYYSDKFAGLDVAWYGLVGREIERGLGALQITTPSVSGVSEQPQMFHDLVHLEGAPLAPEALTAAQIRKVQQLTQVTTVLGLKPTIVRRPVDERLADEIAALRSRLAEVRLMQSPGGAALDNAARQFVAALIGHGVPVDTSAPDAAGVVSEVVRRLRNRVGPDGALATYLQDRGIHMAVPPAIQQAFGTAPITPAGLEEWFTEMAPEQFGAQYPEVAVPAGASILVTRDTFQIHASDPAQPTVQSWADEARPQEFTVDIAGLVGITPGSIVVVQERSERPDDLPKGVAFIPLAEHVGITSLALLIQQGLQIMGYAGLEEQVLGAVRLSDGRVAIFV